MNLENELKQALRAESPNPSLHDRIMERVIAEERRRHRAVAARIAATFAFVALLGVAGARYVEERREGEAARDQVMVAMKITAEKSAMARRAIHRGVAEGEEK